VTHVGSSSTSDRCHRIGQNSRVECLYFVAVGTLDEILWKLLENKFQDLGEFVEGKEKLKLVIERIYHGVKELHSIFGAPLEVENGGDAGNGETEGEDGTPLEVDLDLQKDIEALGKEELTMLLPADADEEELEMFTRPELGNAASSEPTDILGKSEEDAILLSDDDEEESPAQPDNNSSAVVPDGAKSEDLNKHLFFNQGVFDSRVKLPNCRHYTMLFSGPEYGIEFEIFEKRAVVSRKRVLGSTKPAVGDILAAINGNQVPLLNALPEIVHFLKKVIRERPPVRLTFVEDKEFGEVFHDMVKQSTNAILAEQRRVASLRPKPKQEIGEVIDLLDDD
jgi:hypothetical protein